MDNHFKRVTEVGSLDELLARSKEQPVVIFKHSTMCSISAGAYLEMTRYNGEVVLVEVQSARELSAEIARRTGVVHESPQVIVLLDEKVVWNGSHSKVQAELVAEMVRNANHGSSER